MATEHYNNQLNQALERLSSVDTECLKRPALGEFEAMFHAGSMHRPVASGKRKRDVVTATASNPKLERLDLAPFVDRLSRSIWLPSPAPHRGGRQRRFSPPPCGTRRLLPPSRRGLGAVFRVAGKRAPIFVGLVFTPAGK